MDLNMHKKLKKERNRRLFFSHFAAGIKRMVVNPWLLIIVVLYIIAFINAWNSRGMLLEFGSLQLSQFLEYCYNGVLIITGVWILVWIVSFIGTPLGANTINRALWRVGLRNDAGESPYLLTKYKYLKNTKITVMEFEANGLAREAWERKLLSLEKVLNLNIVKVVDGKCKRRILMHTVPARSSLPSRLQWKDEYLSNESFVLVLGESLMGQVTIDISTTPHTLLGGSTGSGKSVLLKSLVMQCVKKGATVWIADFKGGVDFPAVWQEKCCFITSESDLKNALTTIIEELERRRKLLIKAECPDIDEFNQSATKTLPHIVLACDEVAEILDKNGLSKEQKERIAKVESALSFLARQGRAFGIHLILATQRPDATILTGQIKSNIGNRICGRGDSILSQIILDTTMAADKIPKDEQGLFTLCDGTIFKGYMIDKQSAFK